MDLEERTIEKSGENCDVCGVKLTPEEAQTAMESGGPALCTTHAVEAEPALETDEAAEFGE